MFGWFKKLILGGEPIKELGEVQGLGKSMVKSIAKATVIKLKNGEEKVSLQIVAKSPLSYQMLPIALSKDDAKKLGEILSSAP